MSSSTVSSMRVRVVKTAPANRCTIGLSVPRPAEFRVNRPQKQEMNSRKTQPVGFFVVKASTLTHGFPLASSAWSTTATSVPLASVPMIFPLGFARTLSGVPVGSVTLQRSPSAAHARLAETSNACLLYTSDAADDLLCVDLGGRR